jgi:hypothetical protein
MAMALVKYANWQSAFPYTKQDGLGVLAFGKISEFDFGFPTPLFTRLWFRLTVYGAIILFLSLGFWLFAFKKRKSSST